MQLSKRSSESKQMKGKKSAMPSVICNHLSKVVFVNASCPLRCVDGVSIVSVPVTSTPGKDKRSKHHCIYNWMSRWEPMTFRRNR